MLFVKRSSMTIVTAIVVVAVFLFGGGGITAYAASGSLPGDALYPVKTGLESARAGFTGSPHYHKHSEEWFIPIEGAAELKIADGEWTLAAAGAVVFGPRHLPHALRVVGAEPFLMLCIVTPNVPDDETPI